MKNRVGIMQGRMVPPIDGNIQMFPVGVWSDEFALAKEAGIEFIEWIYEWKTESDNPMSTDEGVSRMRSLSESSGVEVASVCADYFMEKPLLGVSSDELQSRIGKLSWLIKSCSALGVGRIVIPFVDNSSIKSEKDEEMALDALGAVLPEAEALNIELHLETDFGPEAFRKFLDRLPHPMLKVNYDSGNSASLGYPHDEELDAYGARLGSVHIKDRVRGEGSVPLGEGDANFEVLFEFLKRLDYQGDFVLQVARGEDGEEVALARSNKAVMKKYWDSL